MDFDVGASLKHLDFSCDVEPDVLNPALKDWAPEDDYVNVLVSCHQLSITDIMDKVRSLSIINEAHLSALLLLTNYDKYL